ncbi:lytic polysaccharide monooxygenase [Trematosphaeria pertusa]|uniref:lytic cellulose monooxygenase (C4-dehydrogenating) n=1 Tax=Trematosphaeria pertusa TaxID=390896 RepID=A0A6A6I624_9PLEO|nr:lytic polysaccharide monooxygenase [Trematosphaeria pertusa]KAF2245766.1 lytic polysaccharide monooxygenase [Trematosphaeria pertusa]
MKLFLFALPAALLPGASAHYIFSRLIVNNTVSTDFQYIRDVSALDGNPPMFAKAFPIYNLSNPDLKCGKSAFPVRNPSIETATVLAGDDVGFHLSGPYSEGDIQPEIFHEGPGQVFLSKLPVGMDIMDYDGSGDFFKIAYAGPANSTTWSLYGQTSMNFTIPATTPPGKYLLRIEQFFASSNKGQSQWYVSCAHVDIVGSGGGTPGPFIRFPNAYKDEDPNIWFHEEGTNRFPKDISGYLMPKPDVWQG